MIDTLQQDIGFFFADFGVKATFAGGHEVTGIFDDGYLEINVGEAGQEGSQPEFHCPTKDLPANADEGDVLEIKGFNWRIKNLMQDATGITVLALERAPTAVSGNLLNANLNFNV